VSSALFALLDLVKKSIQEQVFVSNKGLKCDYHVCEVNERIVDGHDLNSFLQRHSHHQATNAAKSATDQMTNTGLELGRHIK